MKVYNFVFVVLCYRNTTDILKFEKSLKNINGTYKVVLVNNYYDDESYELLKKFAYNHDFDFLNCENLGYGYGNNRGIEFAREKYTFDFCIVSNPDIEIEKLDINEIKGYEDSFVGPIIRNLKGKMQNPYKPLHLKLIDYSQYLGISYRKIKYLYYVGAGINRILRDWVILTNKLFNIRKRKVYTLHGSFLIIGSIVLDKLDLPFDENIFLFAEEDDIGILARTNQISMFLFNNISVLHHEDGSVSYLEGSQGKISSESYKYFYSKWYKKI